MKRYLLCALLLVGCAPPWSYALSRARARAARTHEAQRHSQPQPGREERREEAAEPSDAPWAASATAIARLDQEACERRLQRAGVSFERAGDDENIANIDQPIHVLGPIGGVTYSSRRHDPFETMDCRLAAALLAWAPTLRDAGIARVVHYSLYRHGARVRGGPRTSGHALGLAIDAGRFLRADGEEVVVERDWADRERGAEPCAPRPEEDALSSSLRSLVCDARPFFHTVLTPHYDDAHGDHVHLEVIEGVEWSYVR